jgi:hypothetical protein
MLKWHKNMNVRRIAIYDAQILNFTSTLLLGQLNN